MKHRHIIVDEKDLEKKWPKAAIDSFLERGTRQDLKELISDLKRDSSGIIKNNLLTMAKKCNKTGFAEVIIEVAEER